MIRVWERILCGLGHIDSKGHQAINYVCSQLSERIMGNESLPLKEQLPPF